MLFHQYIQYIFYRPNIHSLTMIEAVLLMIIINLATPLPPPTWMPTPTCAACIMGTSLAPSPIARVISPLARVWVISTNSAFCRGSSLQAATDLKLQVKLYSAWLISTFLGENSKVFKMDPKNNWNIYFWENLSRFFNISWFSVTFERLGLVTKNYAHCNIWFGHPIHLI